MVIAVLCLATAAALQPTLPRRPAGRLAPPLRASDGVVDVEAVVSDVADDAVANAPYPSVVDGIELVLESAIPGTPGARVVKCRVEAPGAAVLHAFDAIRAQAGANLAEPGFRPGDIPPYIRRQMVEFALTTVMEDYVKFAAETHGLAILDDAGSGEDTVKWNEDPAAEAKAYVLGAPFAFHAAFNATLPDAPVPADQPAAVGDLYSIDAAQTARAANILASGGKMPGLLSGGATSKKRGASKKKKKKGPGKKKKR